MTKATTTTIIEGSVQMTFPAEEESTVFYNPVQVQNRDLSILMITLAGERRVLRQALKAKRKELVKEGQHAGDALQAALEEYKASLNVEELVKNETGGLSILDALAASGLRSMRYWKEIPGVRHVTINDLDSAAIERAHASLDLNGLSEVVVKERGEKDGILVQHGDAKHVMYNSTRPQALQFTPDSLEAKLQPQYDVIDLDPYGSAAPFLDGAVQAIENGGLLCITCTDMAALGGAHPETCFGRYHAVPIQRAGYLQEMALRILLYTIATTAAKYGRSIRPVLSVGMNFYVRVFVEVYNDKASVNQLSLNVGSVYQSTQCPSFHIVPSAQLGGKKGNVYQAARTPDLLKCQETGASFKVGGPFWLGPLHDKDVVAEALQRLKSNTSVPDMKFIATRDRLRGLLENCQEELEVPLYYKIQDLSQTMHTSAPPLKEMKAAIVNAGYRVSGYHKEPTAIKTDAPNQVIWDIMRAWYEKNPPKKAPVENSAGAKIMAIESSISVDFSVPKSLQRKDIGVPRFPHNPQANWGPKAKASGKKRKAEGGGSESPTNVP